MAKFNIKPVGEKTVDYVIFDLDMGAGEPILKVRPATDANRDYRDALLKRLPKATRRGRRTESNVSLDRKATEYDLDLYPKHVVVGWENVREDNGKEPEFTEDNVRDLLEALDDAGLFGELRAFCSDNGNFLSDAPDPEEVAGNSPPVSNGS